MSGSELEKRNLDGKLDAHYSRLSVAEHLEKRKSRFVRQTLH